MPRDAKYRHEAKDQGRNSASYAAVQTSARQIPAHGDQASIAVSFG
jgi:hypothetical protein